MNTNVIFQKNSVLDNKKKQQCSGKDGTWLFLLKSKKSQFCCHRFQEVRQNRGFFDKFLFAAEKVLTVTNQFEKAKETLAAMTSCTIAT